MLVGAREHHSSACSKENDCILQLSGLILKNIQKQLKHLTISSAALGWVRPAAEWGPVNNYKCLRIFHSEAQIGVWIHVPRRARRERRRVRERIRPALYESVNRLEQQLLSTAPQAPVDRSR